MTNRLANETSPYLQQHAGNPVDWFPWGEEALELARRNDRPILLSVGYSACHWCHVMAHESFEDDEIAALMNRWFVNVKVDREERPDIDQIYQLAHQLIARRPGGWPLTMFLTPQGKPFYGGTYFPKQARFDLPGFGELLQRVAHVWQTQRAQVDAQGDELVRYLQETLPRRDGGGLPEDDEGAPQEADGELKEADGESRRPAGEPPATLESTARRAARGLREALMREFDATHGGFGGAPKFPQPASLDALLRHAVDARDEVARDAVLLTLRRMAEGGLYDHLGGGFCRYSTDARWTIPHFEKMLYDNGPLLRLYAEAWQLTREPLFREVCEETAAWTMREMQSPAGGYYSSIDADSEGEEGRFYVWQRDEVAAALDDADFPAFAARYGLAAPANFEGHAWHLHVAASMDEVAASAQLAPQELGARIGGARARLFAIREARVKPGRDEKILTSWNALAIDGMAFAGRVFDRPLWQASARAALAFLRDALWRDGRLLATHKDGRSHLNAYLDDYAFLLGAVLEVAQGEALRADDLEFARALADALLDRFEDAREGGFFFTSHDHEALVMRPKSAYDSAMPSGNGVAALHLQRLGHLTGELRYLEAARRTLELFASDARRVPHGMATLVVAMSEYATPPTVAVLTGPPEPLADWRRELVRDYRPSTMVVDLGDGPGSWPQALAKPAGASPQAWVCRATHCLPPIGELEALRTALGDRVAGA